MTPPDPPQVRGVGPERSTKERAAAAYEGFRRQHPAYDRTAVLDDLRSREYSRLDDQGEVYLDYTGAGLYARSQLQQHLDLLATGVFGNPHSTNPTSQHSTGLAARARSAVLHYFNADPQDYLVIFTANASAALRLVGESYPFEGGGTFLLTYENRNSVNGIREFARARGARVVTARSLRRTYGSMPTGWRRTWPRAHRSTPTCSPIRRSPTSPASSMTSPGWRRRSAGKSSSMPPPSPRPTAWICTRCNRISSRCPLKSAP